MAEFIVQLEAIKLTNYFVVSVYVQKQLCTNFRRRQQNSTILNKHFMEKPFEKPKNNSLSTNPFEGITRFFCFN